MGQLGLTYLVWDQMTPVQTTFFLAAASKKLDQKGKGLKVRVAPFNLFKKNVDQKTKHSIFKISETEQLAAVATATII